MGDGGLRCHRSIAIVADERFVVGRAVQLLAKVADFLFRGTMTQAPYDGRFKLLAEDHPELLLRLLGIVDRSTSSEVVHILRELQMDPMEVDHVYRIGEGTGGRLVHFEAITNWRRSQTSRLALYRLLLKQKFKLPVESFIVLMAEKYAPKRMPARVQYEEADGFRIEAPYRVIRLWEIDPAVAFEPGCEALLPWVPLLKGGLEEFELAAVAIGRLGAPEEVRTMVHSIATLAGLRYDESVVRGLLEHLRRKEMSLAEALKVSWVYKDGVKAGRRRGLKKGREEGQLAAKRQLLRLTLEKRFPALGPFPEIDRITASEVLDRVFVAILEAKDAGTARSAVLSALN